MPTWCLKLQDFKKGCRDFGILMLYFANPWVKVITDSYIAAVVPSGNLTGQILALSFDRTENAVGR